MRACIWLNERAAWRISAVPVSARGGASTFRPSCSAAAASILIGAVARLTAHAEASTTMIPMVAMDTGNGHGADGAVFGSEVAKPSH